VADFALSGWRVRHASRMAMRMELDPAVALAGAAQLAALVDELSAAGSEVQQATVGSAATQRRDQLALRVAQHAVELAIVVSDLRRYASAFDAHERAVVTGTRQLEVQLDSCPRLP
jgi:N-acyl-D-aspartate/D-glutamate deacylase